jgi:hypothetical protein
MFTKLSVTKGILPFTVDYTYADNKAGIWWNFLKMFLIY